VPISKGDAAALPYHQRAIYVTLKRTNAFSISSFSSAFLPAGSNVSVRGITRFTG
jgi:hypothetical protein